jgi:hypothetical protein
MDDTKDPSRKGYRLYRKKAGTAVTAVQLRLEFEGFEYRKWGGIQRCKRNDWLLDNGGDVYTVDAETFGKTYKQVAPGRYLKSAPVWVKQADNAGSIETKEGVTGYQAGDYLVFNDKALKDGYAVSAETFGQLYEPCR